MLRSQIIAIVFALITIAFLFNLPKAIINKTDKDKLADKQPQTAALSDFKSHSANTTSEKDLAILKSLRKKYVETHDIKKRYIFADSLATLYVSLAIFDSATKYADEVVLLNTENRSLIKSGNIYYKIYSSVEDPTVANNFAAKAQKLYKEVLKTEPDNIEVKNNLAMTYVTSETPMQAIMLLKEVLLKDPTNETALFSLGLLSMQSGQFEKAIERFKKLTELNKSNWKAHFHLGMAFKETGKTLEAEKEFELVAEKSNDKFLKAKAKENLAQ